ncbi:hypothetical protein B6S59_31145 [Pseudomonas sp. A46]|nr:hypothetical protein [Pseudomonas sp. A46]OWJ89340.1 hypothetical protein B6S59_31145 [Pseudomonas sp. A46]
MFNPPKKPDPARIRQLEYEIRRLADAQQMMLDANQAVANGDKETLTSMGFELDHIEDLIKRGESGKTAFPDYAIRNNQDAIEHLKALLEREHAGESW